MTQRIPRRSRLVTAIRAALRPSTATAAAVTIALATAGSAQAGIENGAPGKQALRPDNLAARDEILFIDAHVVSPEKLLVGTKQGVETIILEEGRDGLEQITEALEQRHPVAVHIVAHGESGKLQLGDTWLDAKQLDENVALIRRWFGDSNKADLLLYACKLAEGAEGIAFVEKLAEIAGADVAASDDVTGIDGDWDLEVVTGDIETDLAFSEITIDDYQGNLGGSVFVVNDNGDGSVEECDEDCTLRDALYEANENNNSPESDTISFELGGGAKGGFDYVITLEESIAITEAVTIEGPGITELAIDADDEDRIFYVNSPALATISDLTLLRGDNEEAGGCIFSTETDLTLNEVGFYDCYTDEGNAGAVYFAGTSESLTVRDSDFDENFAEYAAGAIFFRAESGGALLIENTDFTDNYAGDDGGGEEAGGGAILAYGDNTEFTIRDSYFYDNYSEEGSGGAAAIIDEEGSTVLVENSDFYNNSAFEESAGGGALFFYLDNTEITIRDSNFVENYAGYYGGGAIMLWDDFEEGGEASEVVIENSYFAENYTYGGGFGGGAVSLYTAYGSTLTVRDSEFVDNSSEDGDGYGGAIHAFSEDGVGYLNVSDSFFTENQAGFGGAIAADYIASVDIYSSTFHDNYGAEEGGALHLDDVEDVEIVNSTFSFNEAGSGGGGVFVTEEASVYLRHSTVAFNEAEYGGGIAFAGEFMQIENSIVSDNEAEEGGPDINGDTVYVAFSLISDTSEASIENEGGNIFGVSADLGPLTSVEGVYTPVHIPDPESPAIDAGDPGFTSPPDFDQRDEERVQGGRTDMGSVEQEREPVVIPTLSNWGLALMALLMAGFSFLGFKRRKDES